MSHSSTLLTLTVVLLLAVLAAPGAAAADTAPPVTTVTSRTGSGFIYAGQVVWHGPDCPAPDRMTPAGGDSYVCPPAAKLPDPAPQRRPLPIRWP